jgi:hypothetical protein
VDKGRAPPPPPPPTHTLHLRSPSPVHRTHHGSHSPVHRTHHGSHHSIHVSLRTHSHRTHRRTQDFTSFCSSCHASTACSILTNHFLNLTVDSYAARHIMHRLSSGLELLRAGGKIAIITWKHSECAIVVDFARKHEIAEHDAPLRVWYDQAVQVQRAAALSLAAPTTAYYIPYHSLLRTSHSPHTLLSILEQSLHTHTHSLTHSH